jgi:beta-lactamase class A
MQSIDDHRLTALTRTYILINYLLSLVEDNAPSKQERKGHGMLPAHTGWLVAEIAK